MKKKCVVLCSGGQDSTTCLYWAIDKFKGAENVVAFSVNYGQRHFIELQSARRIVAMSGVKEHVFLETDVLTKIGNSNLLNKKGDINEHHVSNSELPSSFVPGRNLFFILLVAMEAYKRNIKNIVIGTCETDYSGYPDCRDSTIKATKDAVSLGMDTDFEIHTPLMFLTKAETVLFARKFPGCMEALAYSHTCYEGTYPPCLKCPACLLRAKGFMRVGIDDPLIERMCVETFEGAD